ncbi:hypothetical protein ACC808_36765, partial [Rhizobium ruizarguesonis]
LANCAMAGASVATFPWLCLTVFFGPDKAYTNDHITYEKGMMTWWGLLRNSRIWHYRRWTSLASGRRRDQKTAR